MTTMLRGVCGNCGFKTPSVPDGHLGIWLDKPNASPWVHPTNKHIVVLGHPIEPSICESIGCTIREASAEGRLLRLTNYFCKSCGTLYEERTLIAHCGCLEYCLAGTVGTLLGIIVGVATSSIIIGIATGVTAIWLASAFVEATANIRLAKRYLSRLPSMITPSGCPNCASRKRIKCRLWTKNIPCPKCGQRTQEVQADGIS